MSEKSEMSGANGRTGTRCKKDGWVKKKLGEVCSKIIDGSHNPPKGIDSSDFIMLSAQNLDENCLNYGNVRYLTEENFIKEDKRTNIGEGDVLLSIVGSIGKVYMVKREDLPFTLQRSVAVLKPKKDISSLFLKYYLKSQYDELNSEARGVAQKGIYLKQLSGFEIDIPSIQEQQHIVSELDSLNRIIEKQKEQLKQLDELAQSIFYDMFGDPVENIHNYPIVLLNTLCERITKGTTPTSLGYPFIDKGINFVKVEAFTDDNTISLDKLAHISQECHDALSRSKLSTNDILICIAGATVGKVAVVDETILPANTNQACGIIRLIKGQSILHSYLLFYLQSNYMTNMIQGLKKGVAQPNLSLGQLKELDVILPPLPLQLAFASKIEAIEYQKELIKQSLAETENLFNSRMDYYFG